MQYIFMYNKMVLLSQASIAQGWPRPWSELANITAPTNMLIFAFFATRFYDKQYCFHSLN